MGFAKEIWHSVFLVQMNRIEFTAQKLHEKKKRNCAVYDLTGFPQHLENLEK